MHDKLAAQVREVFGASEQTGPLAELLARISASYAAADGEQAMSKRILTMAAEDLAEGNRAVRAERERHRLLEEERDQFFNGSLDLFFIADSDLRLRRINERWQPTLGLGRGELLDRTLSELAWPEDRPRFEQALARLRAGVDLTAYEVRWRHRDGRPRYILLSCRAPTPGDRLVYGVAHDEHDRRRLELELQSAQKLEAVGQLASGIAHEINTPCQFAGDSLQFARDGAGALVTLVGALDRLIGQLREGAPPAADALAQLAALREELDTDYLAVEVPKAIDRALEGIGRVTEIVRAMKDYAHPDSAEVQAADLNHTIGTSLIVCRSQLKHVADVETDFAALPPVLCHASELTQVFLNLLVNASHAIADVQNATGQRGKIRISTRVEGAAVVIAIADTGSGIREEIQARIFEPFFTTKEVGRGTGQGLSIARNIIVNRHGGAMWFDSRPGEGATFFVRIPLHRTESNQEAA